MKATDLMITRAGASTMSEIMVLGIPSIFIPSPYVTNNHQYKNAKALEDVGACKIILESDFSRDTIIREIDKLFDNREDYNKMSSASHTLGIDDSATRIYEEVRKLIG